MKKVLRRIVASVAVISLSSSVVSAQVQLNLRNDISLASVFPAGVAPSAVAWNGTDAFVGAYNNSGTVNTTGIVRISDALNTPTIGSVFGGLSTNHTRGITSLAVSGNSLAASWDNGAGSGDSLRAFDTAAALPTQVWRIGDPTAGNNSSLRGNGVAFDPGFQGAGTGFALLSNNSGFSRTFAVTNGVSVANTIVNTNPVSTTWRDLTFNPTTGDFYARESNRIIKGTRTSPTQVNSGGATTPIAGFTTATLIDNQNIAFVRASSNDFLIANDRSSGVTGQVLSNVVKAVDTNGNPLSITYGGGFNSSVTGVGAYDFAFDSRTQTLAMTDFSNQRLYLFDVFFGVSVNVPEPGTLSLVLLGSMTLWRTKRRRSQTSNDDDENGA